MASEIRIGDVVKLKSGSPLMTVTALDVDRVTCEWWDLGLIISATEFPLAALERQDKRTGFRVETHVEGSRDGGRRYRARVVYGDHCGDGVATSRDAAIGYAIIGLGQEFVRMEGDQPIDTGSRAAPANQTA